MRLLLELFPLFVSKRNRRRAFEQLETDTARARAFTPRISFKLNAKVRFIATATSPTKNGVFESFIE